MLAPTSVGSWTDDNGFVYVIDGSGHFSCDATAEHQGQTLWLDRAEAGQLTALVVEATTPLRALLFAGRPLREPVVAHGPFVMNSEEHVTQAMVDCRAGRFGA